MNFEFLKPYRDYVNFVKTVSFFLCIGAFFLIIYPWQGKLHTHCTTCLSKAEFLRVVLVFFGVIVSICLAFATFVLLLGNFLRMISNRFLNGFGITDQTTTTVDVLKFMAYVLLSSSLAYGIISAIVYSN